MNCKLPLDLYCLPDWLEKDTGCGKEGGFVEK